MQLRASVAYEALLVTALDTEMQEHARSQEADSREQIHWGRSWHHLALNCGQFSRRKHIMQAV